MKRLLLLVVASLLIFTSHLTKADLVLSLARGNMRLNILEKPSLLIMHPV